MVSTRESGSPGYASCARFPDDRVECLLCRVIPACKERDKKAAPAWTEALELVAYQQLRKIPIVVLEDAGLLDYVRRRLGVAMP
jgi:hypothetical protein